MIAKDHISSSFRALIDRVGHSRAAAVAGLAVAWFFLFPPGPRIAGGQVDPAWQAALHMAAHDGLEQGTQIIYTYGPLGYLVTPVYVHTPQWQISVVFGFGSTLALALVVYWLFRTVQPPGTSGLLTAVVLPGVLIFSDGTGTGVWSLTTALAGLGILVQGIRLPTRIVFGFGGITALLALVSPVAAAGAAVALAGSACISAYLHEGLRSAGRTALVYLGSCCAVLVALWLMLGQPLANLDDWARYSANIMSGYAAGMGTSKGARGLVDMGAAIALVCALLVVVWRASGETAKKTRAGAMVLFIALAYLQFRYSFVRHDTGHVGAIFEFAALTPLVFLPWTRIRATSTLIALALLPLVAGQLVPSTNFSASRVRWTISLAEDSYLPGPRLAALADTAVAFVSAERRQELHRQGRYSVAISAGFPGELAKELGEETVHVSPWGASLPYAFQRTTWHPAPVFQDFVAYTAELDELNADSLSGSNAPDIVLRKTGDAISFRMPRWEPPSATLALICNYRETKDQDRWFVLRREKTTRCGDIEILGTQSVGFGEAFSPPHESPDGILLARFSGVADGVLDRLRTMVFKAPEVYVETADRRTWRFVQATQASWHVITAPACIRQVLDGDKSPDVSTLRFTHKAAAEHLLDRPLTTSRITVEYGYVPFRC